MNPIENLYPQNIWRHFSDICSIPHPSHHEEKLSQHIQAFAKNKGLECAVDGVGNLIIRKPATAGMENRRGVILQAHIDMVPEKNSDTPHDFINDPIKTLVDGDWVTAEGTTLGADNGIGVAAAMAVLDADDLTHGPIEVLLTINEEAGMTGAQGLQPDLLKHDILLNLDTEDEGEIYIGCAGGVRINADASYEPEQTPANHTTFKVDIKGLKGGHSGCDIHLYRANAIRLLVRSLKELQPLGARIVNLTGGSLPNAIPREAFAIIALPSGKVAAAEASIDQLAQAFATEFNTADPEVQLTLQPATETCDKVMSLKSQETWLNALHGCPNGVIRMSDEMPGIVETSCNLGVARIADGKMSAMILPRSMVNSARDNTRNAVHGVFEMAGAKVADSDSYPGWKPVTGTPLQQLLQDVHRHLFNKDAELKVIHAGLECGLLGEKNPHWEMISFGPTIRFPHSPGEKVHIASVGRFWQWLTEILKEIPEQN